MNQKTILVVDDDAAIVKTLSFKLKSQGFRVLSAVDGSAAVSTVRQEHPDLILLDITFPPDVAHGGGVPWDGFLIMDWLRRMIDQAKNVPIFVISASDGPKYREKAAAAGALAYFQKPIDHNELIATIQKTIGESSASEPASAA